MLSTPVIYSRRYLINYRTSPVSNRNYGFVWVIIFRVENNRAGIPVPDEGVLNARTRHVNADQPSNLRLKGGWMPGMSRCAMSQTFVQSDSHSR